MDEITKVKLSLKTAIHALTTLLQMRPKELKELIPSPEIGEPDDTIHIIENLQEALNLTLDARKRLMLLGLYEDDHGKKRQIQERTRDEVPCRMEEIAPEYSDSNPTQIPSDQEMEI